MARDPWGKPSGGAVMLQRGYFEGYHKYFIFNLCRFFNKESHKRPDGIAGHLLMQLLFNRSIVIFYMSEIKT